MKNEGEARDSGVLSNPLSFLHNGVYYWANAGLFNRDSVGYSWSLRSANTASSNNLDFNSTALNLQNSYERGRGYAVRCISNTQWSGGLAPDSICPKGWQLPNFTGDKSFTTLINTSYSMKNSENERDSGVLSNPLSFLRSGSFGWSFAGLSNRGGGGDYGSLRSANTTNSNNLYFSNTYLTPQNYSSRGNGLAVRCVS